MHMNSACGVPGPHAVIATDRCVPEINFSVMSCVPRKELDCHCDHKLHS